MRQALVVGTYVAKSVGGIVFTRSHRGDAGAAPPVAPVAPTEQARALRLALQIVTHDFWIPLASAVAHMPTHIGWGCTPPRPTTNEYCLGMGAPALLSQALEIRLLVLSALLQPQRRANLELQEWVRDAAIQRSLAVQPSSPPPPGAPPPPDAAVWIDRPEPLPELSLDELGREPSVGALLRAVHAALALPTDIGGFASAALLKQHLHVQRAWLAMLAAFTASSVGEEAAVAAAVLTATVPSGGAVPSGWACPAALPTQHLAANAHVHAHCEAVVHLVGLWRQGKELPPAA